MRLCEYVPEHSSHHLLTVYTFCSMNLLSLTVEQSWCADTTTSVSALCLTLHTYASLTRSWTSTSITGHPISDRWFWEREILLLISLYLYNLFSHIGHHPSTLGCWGAQKWILHWQPHSLRLRWISILSSENMCILNTKDTPNCTQMGQRMIMVLGPLLCLAWSGGEQHTLWWWLVTSLPITRETTVSILNAQTRSA